MTIDDKLKYIKTYCFEIDACRECKLDTEKNCPVKAWQLWKPEEIETAYAILHDEVDPDDEVSGLADSGTRREFDSGAVRDVAEGKGDMVSFPNAAILRLSKHYEAGAKKYGRWNYTKGIPVSSFMDSALRHIFKYLDGWDDEDHLAAAAFNVLGAMQMEAKHPELIDVPEREGKNRYEY